jgi:Rrf2 family iron-sulfur cluster assembly transcriptional regulator
MAIVDLALHSGGRPVALSDIAQRQEISLSYLEQLFARLRRGGIVRSVRGPGGGYLLAYGTEQMRIADIIKAVDDSDRSARSAPRAAGDLVAKTRALTHDLWDELGNQIHLFLSSVTVDDVLHGRVLGTSGLLHKSKGLALAAQ